LPVTFYKNVESLPHLGDYDITKGRTYWFYDSDVLYPFGHGLSYTTFEYKDIALDKSSLSINDVDLKVSMEIKNTGDVKGDEVVQLYVKDLESSVTQARKKLRAFDRISLEPGETKTVSFELKNEDFSYWDENKKDWSIEAGEFEIMIGSSSEAINLKTSLSVH
jgi:beta-glucosidase